MLGLGGAAVIDGAAELAALAGTVLEPSRVVRAGEGLRGRALLGRVRRGVLVLEVQARHAQLPYGMCSWWSALVLADGESVPRWIDAVRLWRLGRHAERAPDALIERVQRMIARRRVE